MTAPRGPIRRLLIANRGEIALRIVRACRATGIESVVAASTVDRDSPSALAADRVVCIGPPSAAQSYLNPAAHIAAAQMTDCDAIHPGYGFLAENPEFAEACADEGLVFVGPRPEVLRMLGDKVSARAAARSAGVPLSEGSDELASVDDAVAAADHFGYPLIIKPVRGGGGKGMRVVLGDDDMRTQFGTALQEARAAFGDGGLYVEKWIARARHVEVQVAGDGSGRVLHFGDRDCSVQRRQQKLVEEAPAPGLDSALQKSVRQSAVDLCASIAYDSVGTVEFLVDCDRGEYSFLEVNPRIQVEHGVTELVTGVDLVALQIRLAAGEPLTMAQADVALSGHAIQARINAEDPEHDFRPSPGRITRWSVPSGPGTRVDSHCAEGYVVPPFYDSLIAKVMCRHDSRDEARAGLVSALGDLVCEGVSTTTDLAASIVESDDFAELKHHTRWLDAVLPDLVAGESSRHRSEAAS